MRKPSVKATGKVKGAAAGSKAKKAASGKRPARRAEAEKAAPSRIVSVEKRRLFNDFFKIDEHFVSHERFDGAMSKKQRVLVFERGDAASALLYNPKRGTVVVTHQFRLPTLGKNGGTGWLTEAAAGMVAEGETAAACIVREIKEETGYDVARIVPIARFFSSPGGSSELIHLFYAEVQASDRTSAGGGVAGEGEDIRIDEIKLKRFFRMIDRQEIADPKLIVAGLWLRRRLGM